MKSKTEYLIGILIETDQPMTISGAREIIRDQVINGQTKICSIEVYERENNEET